MRTQNQQAVMNAANRVQELQKEYEAIDQAGAAGIGAGLLRDG